MAAELSIGSIRRLTAEQRVRVGFPLMAVLSPIAALLDMHVANGVASAGFYALLFVCQPILLTVAAGVVMRRRAATIAVWAASAAIVGSVLSVLFRLAVASGSPL
jgi:hypothetical protein